MAEPEIWAMFVSKVTFFHIDNYYLIVQTLYAIIFHSFKNSIINTTEIQYWRLLTNYVQEIKSPSLLTKLIFAATTN